jgi:hypothetical protein
MRAGGPSFLRLFEYAEIAMNAALLRAWWAHRQGLDGSSMGKPATTVLAVTGWARSVAGVAPAARNLGEEGKRKGMITTLPVALGRLQAEGEIRRVPVNGRLDQQRYRYMRWLPNPLTKFGLSYEQCITELARRYFSWTGPATLAGFQWFSGLSQKACKGAMEPLRLVPVEADSPRWMHATDLEELMSFKAPKEPQYKLVSSLDGISLLRRDLKSLLAPEDLDRSVPVDKGERALGGLADLSSHAILDRGRLVGLWEFDPAAAEIVWVSFIKPDKAMKKAVAETEAFIRDQVGDARSFSLDSPQSREPKLKALRAARSSNGVVMGSALP